MKITSPGKTFFPRKCGRYSFRFRNPCIHDLHAVFLSSHVMNRCSSAVLQRPDSNSSQEKSPPFSGAALTNQQVSQISRSFGRYSLPRFSIRGTMVKLRGLFKGLAPGHGIMHAPLQVQPCGGGQGIEIAGDALQDFHTDLGIIPGVCHLFLSFFCQITDLAPR